MSPEPQTVAGVLTWVVRSPLDALARRWNYKSAVLSSTMRGAIFFAANSTAGTDAAVAALVTEFVLRFTTAGFYGALTQAFRRVEPASAGTAAAMTVLPAVAHSLEFVVHSWRGTPELGVSMAASIAFTAFSTAFNLAAMRQGVFIVGHGQRSLWRDLLAIPCVIAALVPPRRA